MGKPGSSVIPSRLAPFGKLRHGSGLTSPVNKPLNDFKERGTIILQEFRERADQSKWGAIDNNRVTMLPRVREMEEKYLPRELWRDYEHTLGLRPE